jgi:hypothetical protein
MCQVAFCAGSSYQAAGFCTGTGSCSVPNPLDCSPLACNASGCLGSCGSDNDCIFGDYCNGGSCQPKRLAGQACTADNQCATLPGQTTGHCTEGVCCSSGGCPSCQSCAVSGLEGACTNVPAGGNDPTGTCVDQGAATCQQNGKCDGAASCQLYDASTICLALCESDGSALTSTFCDGSGTCGPVTSGPISCPSNSCIAGPPSTCQ